MSAARDPSGTATIGYDVATALWQGKRPYQEDTILADFHGGMDRGFAVLADGMGGHAAGDLASRLVVIDAVSHLKFLMHDGETLEKNLVSELTSAIETANSVLKDRAAEDRRLQGMGATFLATVLFEDRLHWASVGDSPLYLWREDRLKRLNADHSMAPVIDQMARSGEITKEEAANHPDRNALTSVLMGDKVKAMDVPKTATVLDPGDILIQASDGLQYLDDAEIAKVLEDVGAAGTSREIADALMGALHALDDPAQDNTAILVLQLTEGLGGGAGLTRRSATASADGERAIAGSAAAASGALAARAASSGAAGTASERSGGAAPSGSGTAGTESAPPESRRRWMVPAALLGGAAVVLGLIFALPREQDGPDTASGQPPAESAGPAAPAVPADDVALAIGDEPDEPDMAGEPVVSGEGAAGPQGAAAPAQANTPPAETATGADDPADEAARPSDGDATIGADPPAAAPDAADAPAAPETGSAAVDPAPAVDPAGVAPPAPDDAPGEGEIGTALPSDPAAASPEPADPDGGARASPRGEVGGGRDADIGQAAGADTNATEAGTDTDEPAIADPAPSDGPDQPLRGDTDPAEPATGAGATEQRGDDEARLDPDTGGLTAGGTSAETGTGQELGEQAPAVAGTGAQGDGSGPGQIGTGELSGADSALGVIAGAAGPGLGSAAGASGSALAPDPSPSPVPDPEPLSQPAAPETAGIAGSDPAPGIGPLREALDATAAGSGPQQPELPRQPLSEPLPRPRAAPQSGPGAPLIFDPAIQDIDEDDRTTQSGPRHPTAPAQTMPEDGVTGTMLLPPFGGSIQRICQGRQCFAIIRRPDGSVTVLQRRRDHRRE